MRVLWVITIAAAANATGCGILSVVPNQSQFAPLESLRNNGSAVARVYAAPIPAIGAIASHTWLVVKEADATSFDRWEVWQSSGGPYEHVRHNLLLPTSDLGAGGAYVVAEVIGADAEPIVAFVAGESPTYECRDTYIIFPVRTATLTPSGYWTAQAGASRCHHPQWARMHGPRVPEKRECKHEQANCHTG